MLAKITLAPGQIGFHDALSNIHLTVANPTAVVPVGANTEHLKEAVKDGKILLLTGTLSSTLKHREVKSKESIQFAKRMNLRRPVVNQNVADSKQKKAEAKTEAKAEPVKTVETPKVKPEPKKEIKKPEIKEVELVKSVKESKETTNVKKK
jgi:hypothetical protein